MNFDIKQAQRQLDLLGLKSEIFLRGFFHSEDPRKERDKGRKIVGLDTEKILSWQKEKRGVYIVVNGGGHKDTEVKLGRAIFYEHDDLDKKLQINLWKTLGLPEPTFQIDSGGKSIHSFWVFAEPISVKDWRKIQSDLLEMADADRSIKNPSRVMRLAGALHQNGIKSEIISDKGTKYSYEVLRQLIPVPEKAIAKPAICSNDNSPVPLYSCLTKDDRHIIDNGVGEGCRNDSGAKLARNLIGTALRLESLGYRVEGNPEDLFDDYCDRCSPPIDGGERASIWKSASNNNPKPSLTDEAIKNCIKAVRRSNTSRAKQPRPELVEDKVIPIDRGQSPRKYHESVKDLLTKDFSESELDLEIQAIASKFYKTDQQVWRLYEKLAKEDEKAESLQETAKELDELLKSSNASLDLSEYLPGELIKIKEVYERLCLRPEIGLMQFLTTVSGLLPVGSTIFLNDFTEYEQPMGLYFAIVAEPSQSKTPGQKAIVTKPLIELQKVADEVHRQQMIDYAEEVKKWKAEGQEGPPPNAPTKRVYFINSATQAGLRRILNEQRSHGFVLVHDELASDFRNRSKKYNSGLTEDILSFYDGTGKREALGEGFAAEFDQVLVSLLGSIQPGVISEFLNGDSDPNGYWSRMSLINQPKTQLVIPPKEEQGERINITPLLTRIYERVSRLEKFRLHLTENAKELMRQVINRSDAKRMEAKTQGMEAAWGKFRGKVGRLIALIHITERVFNNQDVEQPITCKTVKKAIKLAYFLQNETFSLYADNSEDNLATPLKQILVLASSKPGIDISARLVSQGVLALKKVNPSIIRGYFDDLAKMGYGQTVGAGTRKKFRLHSESIQTVDQSTKSLKPSEGSECSDFSNSTVVSGRSEIYTSNASENKDLSPTVVNVDKKRFSEEEQEEKKESKTEGTNLTSRESTSKIDLQLLQLAESPSEHGVNHVDRKTTQTTGSTVTEPSLNSFPSPWDDDSDKGVATEDLHLDAEIKPKDTQINSKNTEIQSDPPQPGSEVDETTAQTEVHEFKLGDHVKIAHLNQSGKIVAIQDGQFLVNFDGDGSDWVSPSECSQG